jgi:single-strand DNA-binding protein
VNLSLATKSGYKDKRTQEWVNSTEWHKIVAYSTPAEYAKDLKKGDYVEIEGELHSQPRDLEVVKDKKKGKVQIRNWEVRAKTVKKLAPPSRREENLDAEPITEDDAA